MLEDTICVLNNVVMVLQVGLMAQTGSVYLTVCVAVERYVAVCHPLKAKSLCTFGRAKTYVVCTAILSIGQLLYMVK
jgi:hypothetical protein